MLTPLLFVCQNWRTAVLASTCDNCLLTFNYTHNALRTTIPAWPEGFSCPAGFRRSPLVKRVVVTANLWRDMCNGRLCNTMATMVYENLVFPSATSLELNLHRSPNSGGATFHKERSTDFARSLLRMTPAATNVAVKFFSVSGSGPYHEELYSALLSGLCQGSVTSVAVYSGLYYDLVLPKISASSDLTSITNGPTVACMPFVFLAYFNSATLVALDIEGLAESDWHYLLHGDYENCLAVYTSLKSLTLDITDVPYSSAWAAVEDAAPFPVLTTLSICGDYPFDDDS
ncbi:hypothetical protein GGF42_000211, partial [Coemansia sp. RSA 2424]